MFECLLFLSGFLFGFLLMYALAHSHSQKIKDLLATLDSKYNLLLSGIADLQRKA